MRMIHSILKGHKYEPGKFTKMAMYQLEEEEKKKGKRRFNDARSVYEFSGWEDNSN